jgi:hypothetical protein
MPSFAVLKLPHESVYSKVAFPLIFYDAVLEDREQ